MRKRHSSRIVTFCITKTTSTAGGYDYILWQKAPLTNLVMVQNGIAVPLQFIITGEAAVQSGNFLV